MTVGKVFGLIGWAAASCGMTMASGIAGAAPPSVAAKDFASAADALLSASFREDAPGAAVVVTRGGQVIYSGARGLADLESGRPITPDDAFRLGSITKQFTAAVILQLVEEGRISLDDPVSRFFPDFPAPGAHATVRQLLNHTSGIFDYSKIPGWMGSEASLRPNTTADLVALMRARPAAAEPGTRWEYNNGGYTLLGAIIEKVAGRPWHDVVAARIGTGLGLGTIAYADADGQGPERVRGYTLVDGEYRPARGVHISVAHAAGGLVGSPLDLAAWARALHHGQVVSPALYREMTSPARLADGSTEPYGFGLRLRQIRGRSAFVHGGSGRGLDTDSAYIPSDDLFVAVFSNTDDPTTDPASLVRRLAALALGEPVPAFSRADVDMKDIEPLFGAYQPEAGLALRFFSRNGKLYLGRGDDEKEALPAGEGRFFFGRDDLTWFRVARQEDGVPVLYVHPVEAAAPIRAVRTGPAPAPVAVAPSILQTYVGRYQTEVPVLTVALDAAGILTIAPADQSPMPLRPVSETEFRIDGTPMRVVFHPEGGAVNRLTLYRGARELHGRRIGD